MSRIHLTRLWETSGSLLPDPNATPSKLLFDIFDMSARGSSWPQVIKTYAVNLSDIGILRLNVAHIEFKHPIWCWILIKTLFKLVSALCGWVLVKRALKTCNRTSRTVEGYMENRWALLETLAALFEFFLRIIISGRPQGINEVSKLFIALPWISKILHKQAAHILFFTLMTWFVLSERGRGRGFARACKRRPLS